MGIVCYRRCKLCIPLVPIGSLSILIRWYRWHVFLDPPTPTTIHDDAFLQHKSKTKPFIVHPRRTIKVSLFRKSLYLKRGEDNKVFQTIEIFSHFSYLFTATILVSILVFSIVKSKQSSLSLSFSFKKVKKLKIQRPIKNSPSPRVGITYSLPVACKSEHDSNDR